MLEWTPREAIGSCAGHDFLFICLAGGYWYQKTGDGWKEYEAPDSWAHPIPEWAEKAGQRLSKETEEEIAAALHEWFTTQGRRAEILYKKYVPTR